MFRVVEHLDVVKNVTAGFLTIEIGFLADAFPFEQLEEALGDVIVVAVPSSAHTLAVTTADVTGRKGALLALNRCAADLHAVQRILADGGYVGQPFTDAVTELLSAEV